jgi:[acyl-carrier-protein] S-malonyltransferase
VDLADFDFSDNNFLDDELKSQYISYIYSCSVADILHSRRVSPSFVTGYSMGLYSALYYCGSVSFQDGLMLIKKAWEAISKAVHRGRYGMGMVIGLSEADLKALMNGEGIAWICNQNNLHTFIISGEAEAVTRILAAARAEGALRTNLLPVSKPYHTSLLEDAAPKFSDFLNRISYEAPEYPYLSPLSQEFIRDKEGIKQELIRNLYRRMNWFGTMKHLMNEGTEVFFECGTGDGLTRNFRFIDSSVIARSVARLDQFLEEIR